MDLARRTRGIHLILGMYLARGDHFEGGRLNSVTEHRLRVGGHSHTLLGDFDEAEGPYPTIATNLDGEEVFIVTAWRWGQVLGYINVSFESGPGGRVLEYSGGPIYMDKTTKQDPELQAQVDAWREPFDEYASEVVGLVTEVLDATRCQNGECSFSLVILTSLVLIYRPFQGTLGNFIADSMLDYRLEMGAQVNGAIMNAGV